MPSAFFVDPGLEGTGWAYFRTLRDEVRCKPVPPTEYGVIKEKPQELWQTRASLIAARVAQYYIETTKDLLVIEMPGLWATGVSHASAASGDLFKLAYLVGHISGKCGIIPHLLSPQQWKGQLPKEVVIKRIKRAWPHLSNIGNHESDAIGMGLSYQGGL